VSGAEAAAFERKLNAQPIVVNTGAPFPSKATGDLDGLLLAGALSTGPPAETEAWLIEIAGSLPDMATIIAIDWQADGPPSPGPDLALRFKKGRLCRLLREAGFGLIETLAHHPFYYMVRAVKKIPALPPYANQFVDVAGLEELPRNSMKKVELYGHPVVIANTGQEIVAFAGTCPHADSALDQGLLRRRNVVCPLHSYIWDVYSGEPVEPADEDTLQRYTVRIDSDHNRILVALSPLLTGN
jgi:nitrite reductase/ring-hydroxylating ferredoxin subunit